MNHRFMNRRASPRAGVAMVEFAVIFPLFMMLLFALFEFGRAFMVIELMNNACRIAARMAVIDGSTNAQIKQSMTDFLAVGGLPSTAASVYVIDGSSFDNDPFGNTLMSDLVKNYPATEKDMTAAQPRDLAIFRIEIPFSSVALVTPIWLTNLTLSSQIVMRRE